MLAVFITVNEQVHKGQLIKMSDHSGGKLLFLRLWDVDDEDTTKGNPDGQTDRPSAGKDSRWSSLKCHQHISIILLLSALECVRTKVVEGSPGAVNVCV